MLELDPYRLDRTLRDWAGQQARFDLALRTNGDAVEHAFELVPRSVDDELYRTLVEKSALDPLAEPAARWLAFLLVEHASLEATRRLHRRERLERRAIELPERGELAYREVLSRALLDPGRRAAWLGALRELGPDVADARFRLWEQKSERWAELRRAPLPLEDGARVQAAVERFVTGTEDAYAAIRVSDLAALIDRAVGRDVRANFPARLTTRGIAELFPEGSFLDGLDFRLERPPEPAGASSFLRALAGFGSAWHDAGASRTRPFVLSRDPLGRRSATFGALFALLPLEPSFAERRLQVGRSFWVDYRRALAEVVLLGAREASLRALLALSAFDGRSRYLAAFEELTQRLLGLELPSGLEALFADERGVIQAAALLGAAARLRGLRETHDEDWFRNPRAVEELRAELESREPTTLPEAELDAGANELAGVLSRAL